MWHGWHHSAQKSTRTGVSEESTSWSNVSSVTACASDIEEFLSGFNGFGKGNERPG